MRKTVMRYGIAAVSLLVTLAASADPIILNASLVPGAAPEPSLPRRHNVTLPPGMDSAGTVMLYLCPDGWSRGEGKWHFFVNTGAISKEKPHIYCYNLPDGNLRLLWSKNSANGEVVELLTPGAVNWESGSWKHLAFSWQVKDGKTELTLYIDGDRIRHRVAPFAIGGSEFPREWIIGDYPNWNPQSEHTTRLGRTEIFDRALSGDEIRAAADRRFTAAGGLVFVTRALFPGTAGTITGSADAPAAELNYHWEFTDELGQRVDRPDIAAVFDDRSFRFEFKVPDHAAEIAFTATSGKGGRANPVDFRIESAGGEEPRPELGPFYWQSIWIWGDQPRARINLRRCFVVEDLDSIERAVFQWVTDDGSEVFINGTSIGTVSSWAVPKVRDDLKPLLRRGENVIAVAAHNNDTGAGYLGEMMLVYKDGSAKVIPSDTDYLFTPREIAGWKEPGFDTEGWKNVRVRCLTGQPPYGVTPYRYLGHVWPMTLRKAGLPASVKAGDVLNISAVYHGKEGFPDDRVYLEIRREGREIAAFPAMVTRDGMEMTLSASVTVPEVAAGQSFEVAPVSTALEFPSLGSFSVAESVRVPLVASVRTVNGAPRLMINDRIEPMMLYRAPINFRNETRAYRFMRGFAENGISLFEINLRLARLWNSDGSMDFTALDDHITAALFYAPRGRLIVFFGMDAPSWYVARYPETRYHYATGPFGRVSYASEKWRRDSADILRELLEHIRQQPYYDSIAGFGLDGGEDGQWMQWTGRNLEYLGDYSPSMLKYFHDFLERKYSTIDKLNEKYRSSYAGFGEIAIPSPEVRGRKSPLFFDPVADRAVIDFNQAFSDAVTDNILAYCRIIKDATDRSRIIGAYYGKLYSIAGYGEWGEFGTGRIIASPDIDYLIAVEYSQRDAGKPHSVSAPLASYSLHNKIFVDEGDLRTFLSGSKNWGYAGGMFDTASMIRKMFILSFVKNHGIHWYDLHGGVFDQEGILKALSRAHDVAEKYKEIAPLRADVAVIIDEESLMHVSNAAKVLTARAILHQQNGNFGRMGTNFDLYLQSDLAREDFPEYKMYVFLNAWHVPDEDRAAIDRLKKNGALMVWLYNSGYGDGKTQSGANIERLTGIKMRQLPAGIPPVMRFIAGGGAENGILRGIPPAYTSIPDIASPVFYPADPEAVAVAQFARAPELVAAAIRDFGTYRGFYSAIPVLTPDCLRELARAAGVHIYSEDPGVMLYFGSGLLGIHSGNAGVKKISWPEKADFTDVLTGETIARNTDSPGIPLKKNETRIISVVPRK